MSAICERCGMALDRLPACPRCLLSADIGAHIVAERYELEAEVGHGGMGTVFRARDLSDGSVVAVKVFREALLERPGFVERFRRESRVLALMRHPGIVRFKDWGLDAGGAFMVMEYVDGPSLAGQLPLPPARALELARQVCAAVGYAHRRGVVHRDLKPANVLLDRSGLAKVTDFGIAAFAAAREPGAARLTALHEVVGTPAYMAPEALLGAPPDPRMDVYSLGALFFELLEGRPPQGYFEPPAVLREVLRRALMADPNQRYADAEEMRVHLEPAPKAAPAKASLPPPDRIAAALSTVALGGGLAALLNQLVVATLGSGAGYRPGWWMAVPPPALGLAAVALLLHRWRRHGWTGSGPASHLPQTAIALRLSLLTLALVVWKAAGAPAGWPSWLDSGLHGAQAGGLTAGAWGVLECRRRNGGGDEPFLWLACAVVVFSVVVDGVRTIAGAP